jgi:aspartate aminotransferase
MGRISSRIGAISESATMAIDSRAKALRAEGRDVVGFGAGEPDFPTPAHIVEAAVEACRDPRNHKYTPAAGLPELREAVAAWTRRYSDVDAVAGNVVITNGGKHAVYNAFATLLDPGDEVLLPSPYWVTYPEAISLAGGIPVVVETDDTTGFRVSVEALERAVTERTKVLLFVSPSNPTGAVYDRSSTGEIGRWAAERGLWVVTDEIYEHLVYGDAVFTSLPAVAPEIGDRWIVVNGVAKTFAMTGWRVGWLVGPPDVAKAAANLQSHATSNVANVSQRAALAALTGPTEPVREMREAFDRRRRTMHRMLSEIPGVSTVEPQGAFYAFPNLSGLLGHDLRGRVSQTTLELAAWILEEAEVAIVPGEAFGAPGYARLSYALSDHDLERGVARIADLASG